MAETQKRNLEAYKIMRFPPSNELPAKKNNVNKPNGDAQHIT